MGRSAEVLGGTAVIGGSLYGIVFHWVMSFWASVPVESSPCRDLISTVRPWARSDDVMERVIHMDGASLTYAAIIFLISTRGRGRRHSDARRGGFRDEAMRENGYSSIVRRLSPSTRFGRWSLPLRRQRHPITYLASSAIVSSAQR